MEGVAVLWILDELGLQADYHIYVRNIHHSDDYVVREGTVADRLEKYENERQPALIADLVVDLSLDL